MNLNDARDITVFAAYFEKLQAPIPPEQIEWEIGNDYISASGNRRRLIAFDRCNNPVFLVVKYSGTVYDDDQCVVYSTGRRGEYPDSDEIIVGPWVEPKKPERRWVKLLKSLPGENPVEYALWDSDDYGRDRWEIVGSAWVVEGEFAKEDPEAV